MSDTEEVVISRSSKSQLKVNTKPEIAREKLKEKRERLKREKDEKLIEEAKKRLQTDSEKKLQEEAIAKQQEEEKKKADPSYALLMKMEQMMAMMGERQVPYAPSPLHDAPKPKAKRVTKPKVEEEPEKPKRKTKEPKPITNKSKGLPKQKKKVVYLQQEPQQSETNQFVGYDIAPPAEPIQYQPSSGLLSAMMGRRNMNSFSY
jgi:ATP/maltotriose-dependent transcriptional regulator MalT